MPVKTDSRLVQIRTAQHPLLREFRQVLRGERKPGAQSPERILLEGPRLIAEALRDGRQLEAVLFTPSGLAQQGAGLLPQLSKHVAVAQAPENLFALAADAEKIIVMDADFQHPLEKVPELAAALDNSEMAVGCRTKNENWGLGRQVISLGGNWTARAVFALRGSASCSDPVSGFFGFRKSLLGKISRRRVVGEGFKVLVDVLKQLGKGTKIAEVPYVFVGRDGGGSKFRARHALLFLKSLLS